MVRWSVLSLALSLSFLVACGSTGEGEGGSATSCVDDPTICQAGFECNALTGTCLPATGGDAGADAGVDAGDTGEPDTGAPDTGADTGADTSTDPCDGVVCTDPPADTCEGNTAVAFPANGVCTDGTCGYAETRTDCGASAQVCMSGQCVDPADPCENFSCVTPPPVSCEGDTLVRPTTPGTCSVNVAGAPECSYDNERVDCTADGNVCRNGACVAPDPCEGVDCSAAPANACDGLTISVRFEPGVCVAGECEYPSQRVDCNAGSTPDAPLDNACSMGECIERPTCFGVECNEPPVDNCLGDVLRRYEASGTCTDDRCAYVREDIDCAATGDVCQAGECVAPTACTGLECTDPPSSTCRGDIAIVFASPGTCTEGICDYDEISQDCAAAGGFCDGGACEFFAACDDVDCSTLPRPTCDDVSTVLEFIPPADGVECRDGVCQFDETRSECGAREICDDGLCIMLDPCDGVSCEREPFCDGDTVVTTPFAGTCDDGVCDYSRVEQREDCTLAGLRCGAGACQEPGAFLNPGELVVSEYANGFLGEEYSWFEVTSTLDRTLDVSGVTVTINDEVIRVPAGTLVPPYGSLIFNNGVFEPEGAAGLEYETILGNTFSIEITGVEVIERLVVDATWPHSTEESTQLDIAAFFVGNDDPLDWCLTDDPFYGPASPGALSGPCAELDVSNLVVTELMGSGTFGDAVEQYIEFVVSDEGGDLSGARVVLDASVWTFPPNTIVGNEERFVIAGSRFMANGSPIAVFGNAFSMNTDEGALRVLAGTRTLASLDWLLDDGWIDFADGFSLQLAENAEEADVPEAWCLSTTDDEYAAGNYGTPGVVNTCFLE